MARKPARPDGGIRWGRLIRNFRQIQGFLEPSLPFQNVEARGRQFIGIPGLARLVLFVLILLPLFLVFLLRFFPFNAFAS